MVGWFNYRIIEIEDIYEGNKEKNINTLITTRFEIREVYYDGEGEPFAWSGPEPLLFDDYLELKEIKRIINKAKKKTILKIILNENGEETDLIDTGKYIKEIKEPITRSEPSNV